MKMIQLTYFDYERVYKRPIVDTRLGLNIPGYNYNHFKWLRDECERINGDPGRCAEIREDDKGRRALFVNEVEHGL